MTLRRMVGTALLLAAAGLVWFGLDAYVDSRQVEAAYNAALNAELIRVPIDLAKPAQHEIPLHVLYPGAHGVNLFLEFSPPANTEQEATAALGDLAISVALQTQNAQTVAQEAVTGARWASLHMGNPGYRPCLPLYEPRQPGQYKLTVTVTQPASGMANRSATLVAKYSLCGIEMLGATVGKGFAILGWIVSLPLVICGIRLLRRQTLRVGAGLSGA